jgi:hypothetical protein
MRIQFLLLLLVVLMASAAAWEQWEEFGLGGYSPINDINDPQVTKIANFAVTRYNKRSETKLKFEKVIKGESQAVGLTKTNYKLTLSASNGSVSNTYETVVYENLWGGLRAYFLCTCSCLNYQMLLCDDHLIASFTSMSYYFIPIKLDFDAILNLFSWKIMKLIVIIKYDCPFIFVCIFLFDYSIILLEFMFNILIFNLHNSGYLLSAIPIPL